VEQQLTVVDPGGAVYKTTRWPSRCRQCGATPTSSPVPSWWARSSVAPWGHERPLSLPC